VIQLEAPAALKRIARRRKPAQRAGPGPRLRSAADLAGLTLTMTAAMLLLIVLLGWTFG
jgi:hypothetical protein